HIAEDLTHYRHWQPYLHDLGECEVKHGLRLHLVHLYKDNLGNPQLPDKVKRGRRWKQTSGVSIRPVITPRWTKYVLTAVLLVSAVALAISFSVFYRRGSPAVARSSAGKAADVGLPIPEKSIAVLPFENRSEDKANAYFADGIQDEILTRLSKIADLKVISHTSTQGYKSAPENLREIATQLGVAHILEGSVQKSGDAVRVNVQLIKAANESHLWADTFDRKLTDIFSVESEVAKAIADQLRAKLTGQEEQLIAAKSTDSPEDYDAAVRYFQRARQLLPNNSQITEALAYVARRRGEWDRSEAYFNEAEQIDPRSVTLLTQHAFSYIFLGRFPEALRKLDQVLDITPNDVDTLAEKALTAQAEGDLTRAATLLNPLRPTASAPFALEAQVYQTILERQPARLIRRLKELLAEP